MEFIEEHKPLVIGIVLLIAASLGMVMYSQHRNEVRRQAQELHQAEMEKERQETELQAKAEIARIEQQRKEEELQAQQHERAEAQLRDESDRVYQHTQSNNQRSDLQTLNKKEWERSQEEQMRRLAQYKEQYERMQNDRSADQARRELLSKIRELEAVKMRDQSRRPPVTVIK